MEDAVRGRVFGAYGAVAQLLVLLGMLVSGAAVSRTGIIPWLYVLGGLYVLAGVVALVLLRSGHEIGEDRVHDDLEGLVSVQAS